MEDRKRVFRLSPLAWIGRLLIFVTLARFAMPPALAAEPAKRSDGSRQAAEHMLRAYEEAWSQHDAHAVASFYHEPAVRVSPGGPTVRESPAVQEAFFTGLLASLVKQGYATSSWERLEVRLLDAKTAIASGVVVRRRADGTLFQRQGVTYGLWRDAEGWRIFLSATHAPSSALHFE